MASNARNFGDLPLWRRVVLVVLIPFVLPAVALVFLLLTLILVWNSSVYGVYWLRWKMFGIPIPPLGPQSPAEGPAI
jgi:hypothetical protein